MGEEGVSNLQSDLIPQLHDRMHTIMAWDQSDPERDRCTPRGAFVFLKGNGFIRQLVDCERPEKARNSEPEHTFSNGYSRANAPTAIIGSAGEERTAITSHIPSSECPVVSIHHVTQFRRVGTAQSVIEVSIGIEGMPRNRT